MVKEIISLCIGESGIKLGNNIWKQYSVEHNIHKDGIKNNKNNKTKDNHQNEDILRFFEESSSGTYYPRNLMIDLDDNISSLLNEFNDVCYLNDYNISDIKWCGSGGNYARSYNIGTKCNIIDFIENKLRIIEEKCDKFEGYIINRSISGGTGSGLTSLILDRINDSNKNHVKNTFDILPFINKTNSEYSNCMIEPFNNILSINHSLDHSNIISTLLDNEQIYKICQDQLEINKPTLNDINRLIVKVISSITTPLRYIIYILCVHQLILILLYQ